MSQGQKVKGEKEKQATAEAGTPEGEDCGDVPVTDDGNVGVRGEEVSEVKEAGASESVHIGGEE